MLAEPTTSKHSHRHKTVGDILTFPLPTELTMAIYFVRTDRHNRWHSCPHCQCWVEAQACSVMLATAALGDINWTISGKGSQFWRRIMSSTGHSLVRRGSWELVDQAAAVRTLSRLRPRCPGWQSRVEPGPWGPDWAKESTNLVATPPQGHAA